MAETLGSLVDKLTIKSIREFFIKDMLTFKKTKPVAIKLIPAFSQTFRKHLLQLIPGKKPKPIEIGLP